MAGILVGYARGSTDKQDLDAQREALLRMRTREGMAIARAKGRLRGRQPKLSARQRALLIDLQAKGEHTIAELAEMFSVPRPTVYRVLGGGTGGAAGTPAGETTAGSITAKEGVA